MIYFPCIKDQHYFLIVFNIEKNHIHFVDNMYYSKVQQHQSLIGDLRATLLEYMDLEKKKKQCCKSAKATKSVFHWRVSKSFVDLPRNGADCGIYLMMHLKLFQCGKFDSDLDKQENLDRYRIMLLGQILLDDFNEEKDKVVAEISEHYKLEQRKLQRIEEIDDERL